MHRKPSGPGADADADVGTDADGDVGTDADGGGLFSFRTFLVALVASLVGLVVGGSIPVVGTLGRFGGLFVVAFAFGIAGTHRRYLELGFAGALAAGGGFVLSAFDAVLFPVVAQYGVEIAGVGAATGLLVALAGHYFGRDLRDGLTRELR